MAALMPSQGSRTKPVTYTAVQLQTSSQGLPVPVHYGTCRVSNNMLWYDGFKKRKLKGSGKGGALGGAAGKNGGDQYQYSADVILGVCEGPIQGFGQVWASKVPTSMAELGLTEFLGTYPQAAWGYVTANYPSSARPYTGIAYLGGSNYQLGSSADTPAHTFEVYGRFSSRVVYTTTTIPGSPFQITIGRRTWADGSVNSMWQSNVSIPGFTAVGGAPGPGQYRVVSGVYTFNAADAGTTIEIAWNGKGQDADPSLVVIDILTNENYGVGFPRFMVGEMNANSEDSPIPGGLHQIVVNNAATFIDNLSVYVAASDTLFTCVGELNDDPTATPGPLEYVYDQLTGTYTFNVADFGKTVSIAYTSVDQDLTTFQDYCWAQGFFISPSFTNPVAASAALEDIAKYCNSEIVWSAGALKLVPRGDKDITANGHSYTAPSATVKDLDDDDYQLVEGDDPLVVTRRRVADAKNVVQIECLDRSNQYNAAMVDSTDQAAVDIYGRRTTGSMGAHLFCDPTIARIVAQLLLQREAVRNSFTFQLDARYVWLDPMDIVSAADAELGLDSTNWVRIIRMEEEEDGSLTVEAEEYAIGVANSETYEYGTNDGFAANYNVDPGMVNDPMIFEPSVQLATNTGLEVWCAVSGADPNWGGADVYVSTDDITYNYVGRQWGASRMGELTAILPLGTDPDTVNTISVDLTESFGELISGTTGDADLGNTVCMIGTEMISFETADMTAPYNYDLKDYLRRGQYGTTIQAHPIGTDFARLDETIFTFPYDKTQIGQTVYVKFCSFNSYGGGLQDVSIAVAHSHVIVGPPLPGTVENFAVIQQGGPVVFSWEDLPDFVLKGYDILYGEVGGTVDTATFLTDASRSTEMTHANVPPGTWTFYIRGHDLADQVGPASQTDFTVKNFNFEIAVQENDPDWFGTTTNAVRHVSGVVVPQGQNNSNTYGWEVFDQFVPDPFATPIYEGVEIDALADGDMRVILNTQVSAATAYGETGVPAHVGQIKWKLSAGAYNAFQDWISGTVNARYVTARYVLDVAVQSYLTALDVLLDNPPFTQVLSQQIIDVAGTTVFWHSAFRNEPNVQVTPAQAGATSGSAENITVNGALIKLWNGSVQVAGVANIAATGV